MPDLTTAYNWAIDECNKPNVGYSQTHRNQQTVGGVTYYDCSSFIWYALKAGDFDVNSAYKVATGYDYSGNAITTQNLEKWLRALGFASVDINGVWKPSDIVWRVGHTEIVYSGGNARGITMGAHSSTYELDRQVSINTHESTKEQYSSLWRYGGAGLTVSLEVVSAICGNWYHESSINPAIWEGLQVSSWTSLGHGYGLGQWTNTGGDTHGRLYRMHEYLIANGYPENSGQGQLEYFIEEGVWYSTQEASDFSTLTDFLTSDSNDIEYLTHAFNIGWEGIHDSSWDIRVTYANECYEYLLEHYDDKVEWISGNRFLSKSEILNNAVLVYQYLSGHTPPIPPVPPTPPQLNRKSNIWIMLKRR